MAVGKRNAVDYDIHINIEYYSNAQCAAAMGQGTSNKCHYKRAWDWLAPDQPSTQYSQQSGECQQ